MDPAHDLSAVAEARRPSVTPARASISKEMPEKGDLTPDVSTVVSDDGEHYPEPTDDELDTLRRVSGPLNWQSFTVAFVEFCERFSWYGTTALYTNFVQQPTPPFSDTGAITTTQECYDQFGEATCVQPGFLGQGQRTAFAMTTLNQFWAYLMPLVGGYIADTFLGRMMTIQASIVISIVGHVFLIISAVPSVANGNTDTAFGLFAVGLIVMGVGTGGFKSNVSPLIAEQIKQKRPFVKTLPSGERVIQDPAITLSRVFLYFYMMINIGSLAGGIGMVYVERRIGFWLAYALPTFILVLAPIVLLFCQKYYTLSPPTGSVLNKSFSLLALAFKKTPWSANPVTYYKHVSRADFWEDCKPSVLGTDAPRFLHGVDDAWVEQVARGFNACKVFMWLPLYWLAYSQMTSNLTAQSATLTLNGVPNDLINNLNPITLVIFIPIVDYVLYPALRKARIRFTPIKRIAAGFWVASAAMISACVVQYFIYQTSACPNTQVNQGTWEDADGEMIDCTAPINVWVQAVPYCIIGFSEIFASITGLEYAVSKAPENMRGLVMGVNLLQTAFSSAIGQALTPLSGDPLLVWNYMTVAILAFVGGIGFWFTWRSLDKREDELNMIAQTKYKGRKANLSDEERIPE